MFPPVLNPGLDWIRGRTWLLHMYVVLCPSVPSPDGVENDGGTAEWDPVPVLVSPWGGSSVW